MSIGRRSRRKRPRNDLDDYLDEVAESLFCVTRADRRCLINDLKAHVREITTDPANADRFTGKYRISREQLVEEIGHPSKVSNMYIRSVGKKIPSIGYRLFIILMGMVFFGSIIIGLYSYGISKVPEIDTGWSSFSGVGLVLCGLIAVVLVVLFTIRFDKYHSYFIYLALLGIVLSIPFSLFVSRQLSRGLGAKVAVALQDWLSLMFIIEFVVLWTVGFFIVLKHFQVMNPRYTTYI